MAMRMMMGAVLMCAMAGCSSSSSSSTPSLDGNWLYQNSDGTAGLGLTFKSDGTYVGSILKLTSSTAANAEAETGTFMTGKGTISFTPKQYTCSKPDPAYTYNYSFMGGNLVLTLPTGIIEMTPNNMPASQAFAIQLGCFDMQGNFTAQPLANVSN